MKHREGQDMQVGAQEGRARETCCEHHSHPEPRTAHFPESVPLTHLGPQVDHTFSHLSTNS